MTTPKHIDKGSWRAPHSHFNLSVGKSSQAQTIRAYTSLGSTSLPVCVSSIFVSYKSCWCLERFEVCSVVTASTAMPFKLLTLEEGEIFCLCGCEILNPLEASGFSKVRQKLVSSVSFICSPSPLQTKWRVEASIEPPKLRLGRF